MSIDKNTETLLRKLEDLASDLDGEKHGKQPAAGLVADLIGSLVDQYREAFGDE